MELETLKFVVSSTLQLAIAIGAWYVALSIHRGAAAKQNEDLRVKLYEKRYDAYLAFKAFIDECVVQDIPTPKAISAFVDATQRLAFLFGHEVSLYKKELLANALALRGVLTGAPCTTPPSVGSLIGYFPGSSRITDPRELVNWFVAQKSTGLDAYFRPYLDFSLAGVTLSELQPKAEPLPEPPLVRRRIGGPEVVGGSN